MALDIAAPSNYPVRPLNKGMVQDLPPNALDIGAFYRVQNYRAERFGLKKRGGLYPFDLNNGNIFNETLYDIIYFYKKAGGADMLYVGDKTVSRRTGSNTAEPLNFISADMTYVSNSAYDTGTQSFDIVFDTVDIANLFPGDYLITDGGTSLGEVGNISTGTNTLTIFTIDNTITANMWTPGDLFHIQHYLKTEPLMTTSFAVLPTVTGQTADKMVIADQSDRSIYQYVGGTDLEEFPIDSSVDGDGGTQTFLSAKTLCYFSDRLWFGNTIEADGQYPQRIRWSEPASFNRVDPASYLDLPYSEGKLLALVPLGSLLIAYFEDAIYVGRETSIIGLPFTFERLETGTVGIVNSKAVVRWTDGHFFIGEDDIYFLSGSTGIEQIGSPVIRETIDAAAKLGTLQYAQVEHDPRTNTICFIFPDAIDSAIPTKAVSTRLWRFNYFTKAWTYDEVAFRDTVNKTDPAYYFSGLLPSKTYIGGSTWEEWIERDTVPPPDPARNRWLGLSDGDPDIDSSFQDFNSWIELSSEEILASNLKLGIWQNSTMKQIVLQENEEVAEDDLGTETFPVWCLIESGDYDFGIPDTTKTVTRLSIKLDRDIDVEFTLTNSERAGYTWKRPGRLTTYRTYNEGHADFHCTGSTYRFKLVNSQSIEPYRISEFVIRVIGRGLQISV